ncbi:MAG: hypothetical protein KJ970_19500 [Candidatus Eisenbacteria bacterium]|uniref:DNA/pantothenate metabolism flavoprotein C-terminal domain-containing protein n=1 Tax=Eiseniibacteriota bacterium TaxID=2212470 RepID=A0A948RY04_UNCEI|nr:hypothetical protein [Candidatus Eisenbacteria bacterium]MBU1948316.1 hypothetical protein [Candidatus Eisenbacteria bacterium]MBU2693108.1 hypothetical protein [Candidatus Eisenbacteria bacterium]
MTAPKKTKTEAQRPLRGRRILLGIGDGPSVPAVWPVIQDLLGMGITVQAILTPEALRWTTPEPFRVLTGLAPWVAPEALLAGIKKGVPLQADLMAVVGGTAELCLSVVEKAPQNALSIAMLSYQGPGLVIPAAGSTASVGLQQMGWESPEPLTADAPAHEIVAAVVRLLLKGSPACPILVTAGPTREPIDPVRYLSNRSSGRMGYAIAEAARNLGHPVTLVSGPDEGVALPPGVERIRIETAEEMLKAVISCHRDFPILIMAAAVADYRPRAVSATKIRRDREARELELVANPDILLTLRGEREDLVTVGFAIEGGLDETALQGAQRKLETKGLAFVVLNDPQRPDSAFGGGTSRVRIVWNPADAESGPILEEMPVLPKVDLGRLILERAIAVWKRRSGM